MTSQEKRNNDIKKILRSYKEYDVSNDIIKKIKKKYPKLKHSEYIRTEEINDNDIIQMVSLDMKKISISGKCIKIEYSDNKTIENILLVNNILGIYWRIKPTKYYIFRVLNKHETEMKDLIEKLYKKIKNK
jgi:hypothetical protein